MQERKYREEEYSRSLTPCQQIFLLHLGLLNLICEGFRGENQKRDSGSGSEAIMLRKRSRSFQKDQYKGHLMSDSSSESSFQPDGLGQKQKNGSFFSIPGLFVGFNVKGVSDSDSVRSPTSPLDYKFLTNLGNPFRSAISHQDGPQKSWNCSKVGLGIVDSLDDETKPPGKVPESSKSRNILFGSQMGINIPSSPRVLNGSIDSCMETNSLPKDFAVAPHDQINFPNVHLNSSENEFGTGRIQLEPKPFERNRSCLSDSGRPASPLSSLTYCDPILKSEIFCSDENTRSSCSPPIIGGGPDFNNFLGMEPSSLSMSFGSGNGIIGSVPASEIELSEDYTCVITHGPNPKTTHIFCDCILECHANELANCCKKNEQGIGSAWVDSGYLPNHSDDFLSFCYFCKKKLDVGKDIYMYRGEKAFCSSNCRSQEILVEEEMEDAANNSSENSSELTCCEEIFQTGMVVTT